RCLTGSEARHAAQADIVRDLDDVLFIEQVPVDVEHLLRLLPVTALAGEPDHGELFDHPAHLCGGDVEFTGCFVERHLSALQQVRHESEIRAHSIDSEELPGPLGHDASPPPSWAATIASKRAMTAARSSAG